MFWYATKRVIIYYLEGVKFKYWDGERFWYTTKTNKTVAALKVKLVVMATIMLNASVFAYSYFQTRAIEVSGAWALYPIMVKWAEEFRKIYPNVRIDVSAGGAGKGMADALAGLVDIGMVSREIYPEEIKKGAFWVSVCKDAVIPTMNKNNPVLDDLLRQGVKKSVFTNIWIYGNITTWGEVVGKPEVTDPIILFTRSDACGAAETWAKYLGCKQEDLGKFAVGVYGDPGLADAVKGNSLGMGYNNVNYAYDEKTKKPVEGITIIPLDLNENGQVDDNEDHKENFYGNKDDLIEAIANGVYPSPPARNLNLVTKDAFTGMTNEFVTWILRIEGGQQYVEETGYIQLSPEKIKEEMEKLK